MKYGRLTLIRFVTRNKNNRRIWLCKCECGVEKEYILDNVKNGNTKSCGCITKELPNATIHGMAGTRVHNIWMDMLKRVTPYYKESFKYYARNIKVCNRWQLFENFFADMGHPPNGYSIERINNDGDYSPENCKWASAKEQANNRRSSRLITYKDETLTLQQWANRFNIGSGTIAYRIKAGWPLERVFR